jgi:uncharacterized beta-barrel protein YwiB (DUF1934 family)
MRVRIEITNIQQTDEQTDELSTVTKGFFETDGEEAVLNYEENDELGGETEVTVSGGDFVSVCRTGSYYNSEMFFEKGKTRPCVYNTPYGEILLETKTYSVTSLIGENNGYIEFEYDILQGGVKQSHNRMRINFSEEKDV